MNVQKFSVIGKIAQDYIKRDNVNLDFLKGPNPPLFFAKNDKLNFWSISVQNFNDLVKSSIFCAPSKYGKSHYKSRHLGSRPSLQGNGSSG